MNKIDLSNFVLKTSLVAMWSLKPKIASKLSTVMQEIPIFMEVSNPKWNYNKFIIHGSSMSFKINSTKEFYKINDKYLVKYLVKLHNSIVVDKVLADFDKDKDDKLLHYILEDALINVA